MSDEFGPNFVSVTDEDGQELVLEYVASIELDGQEYRAFFPAETEGEEEDPDTGLVILKLIEENGEELLSTCDSEEELSRAYDVFMGRLCLTTGSRRNPMAKAAGQHIQSEAAPSEKGQNPHGDK